MSGRQFCTYFDHRYLARGLALHASLVSHSPGHTLWVLCLSKECEHLLRQAAIPGIRVIPLAVLNGVGPTAGGHTGNQISSGNTTSTCSPCLPRYILAEHAEVDEITYLDSDLYFFSSPEPVFAETAASSIAIIPHRFPANAAVKLERYGRYNVGWLTFRRSKPALDCLDWWRERCIKWCFDRVEADRFADQKYLDQFESLFSAVHSIRHVGANLGPWNVANHVLADGKALTVDGGALISTTFRG